MSRSENFVMLCIFVLLTTAGTAAFSLGFEYHFGEGYGLNGWIAFPVSALFYGLAIDALRDILTHCWIDDASDPSIPTKL